MVVEVEMFESPDLNPLFFCQAACAAAIKKEKWILEMNFSLALWMLLPAQRNINIASDEQHAIFAHELQSALSVTVVFSNIYCGL